MVKPAARRQVVGWAQAEYGISERRACAIVGSARSSHRYCSHRPGTEALVEQLKLLATKRPRFGYRRLHLLLRRQGVVVNHKRIYRLYRAEGLSVRMKRRRRLVAAPRLALPPPTRINERWSMDFVSDVTETGVRFRVLTIVDDFSRRCVALVPGRSFGQGRLARILRELGATTTLPTTIVTDNGSEFTSKATDQWAWASNVTMHFIRPGKPVENAYIESFNGKFRDECLNATWFADVDHARAEISAWRDDYNNVRPHSSLDGLTPAEYERASTTESRTQLLG